MLKMATVKMTDGGELARSFWNRQHPRQTILQQRGVAELREGLVNLWEEEEEEDEGNVQYEMTAEEVERRERRKEQNRRAARKFRQKKHAQRSMIAQMLPTLRAAKQDRETEVRRLREELAQLTRQLEDHKSSGLCHLTTLSSITRGQSRVPLTSQTSPTSSVTSPPVLRVPVTSPATLTSPVSSPESWEAKTTPLRVDGGCDAQPEVDWGRYLQDLEPMVPDSTFPNLETLLTLESLDSIIPPGLLSLDLPQKQQQQQQYELQPSPPPPPQQQHEQPPQSSNHSFALMGYPESPEHSSLYACSQDQSLLCPLTATTNQNHLSISASTTYDWSALSPSLCGPLGEGGGGQSQSLSVVPVITVEDEDIGFGGGDTFLFDDLLVRKEIGHFGEV